MEIFDNLIIFEMANNHQGSVEHGLAIIKAMGKIARENNVRAAVKLQYRNLDTFVHPDFKDDKEAPHISRFMSTRLSFDQFTELVEACKREGLITMSTPFDEDGVDLCVDQGLDIIKVASCSSLDWPLLEKIAATKKPLIISTGGKTLADIDNIYNFFTHRRCRFALMHCVAEYPVPVDHLQLDFIDKLKKRYSDITVGYSGHEDPHDISVPMIAVAKGARIFERHVGLPTDKIKLNAYSMNPEQADAWVKTLKLAANMCALKKGDTKYISQAELDSLNSLMRGIYTSRPIKKGEAIHRSDVFFAMPCQDGQTPSGSFVDGMVASRDYSAEAPIYESRELTDINIARSVIHDAKGLLFEAGIALGDSFEVELSHHYGIKHFRQTGAILISIVNREYCKKLLIVLPGQSHPSHMHRLKEETFQLLYGDLELTVDSTVRNLKPGDIQTILRGEFHSFSSRGGAIFEEISTTAVKGDSVYADERINKMDYMERKTIIKDW